MGENPKELTIIVPVLNAAASLPAVLASVAGRAAVIVVDGGSVDATVDIARSLGAAVMKSQRGRGLQLRVGADAASTDWLLFLHADTKLDDQWDQAVAAFQTRADATASAAVFQFALDDASRAARRLERIVAWRTRFLALPYGDQGLLIHRSLYNAIGGFNVMPIMEDVDIIRRLGRKRLHILPSRAITSAERWRKDGWLRRSGRNLLCLTLYFAGVPPKWLLRIYG